MCEEYESQLYSKFSGNAKLKVVQEYRWKGRQALDALKLIPKLSDS